MKTEFKLGIDFAKELDTKDPLKEYRQRFFIQEGTIYMDGNSLGMASKDGVDALEDLVEKWKLHGIGIWNIEAGKYFLYQDVLGELMAPLINAKPEEVTLMANTTLNLHSALATLYHPTKDRYKILVDDLNFPTDRYAVDSQIRLHGLDPDTAVKVVNSADGRLIDEDQVIEAMTDDVALVLLPTVLYRSAQIVNMKKVTQAAHDRGILIGWDLCHAIGAIEMDFQDVQPDFAVWCTYKYLNGGPGSVAGFYLNERHLHLDAGLAGWQGNNKDTQFQLNQKFEQNRYTAGGFQTGTQALLSMAPLEGTLSMFNEIGMPAIREKSLKLTAYLMYLIDEMLTEYGYSVGNPRVDAKRAGHVCLEHPEAYRICQALREHNVIPDFREPNVVRLAPIAFYNSYTEIHHLVEILKEIVVQESYLNHSITRALVV